MKPSVESCGTSEPIADLGGEVQFPSDDAFRPRPPLVTLKQMIERNADLRRWFRQGIPSEEDRLRTKCDVEFVLRPFDHFAEGKTT